MMIGWWGIASLNDPIIKDLHPFVFEIRSEDILLWFKFGDKLSVYTVFNIFYISAMFCHILTSNQMEECNCC